MQMGSVSTDDSYSPEELKKITQQFLPAGATLLAPEQPAEKERQGQELILAADLNRDGRPEVIAGYRVSQGGVGVMVLQKKEKWGKVWQQEGKGYSLERLQAADITGDGQQEMLIGGTIGASAGNGLDILSWQDEALQKIASLGYHRLEVEDLAGEYGRDGKQELAVWSKDTGDAFSVEVLRWDGQKLAPAEDVYAVYFPRVVEYYRKKTEEYPAGLYWYYLADALTWVNDYQGALSAAEEGMAQNDVLYPGKSSFQMAIARAYLGLGRYQKALEVYQGIIDFGKNIKPEQDKQLSSRASGAQERLPGFSMRAAAEAYYGAGEAYLGLGKIELAEENFKKAAAFIPDWDKPRRALARLPLQEVAGRIYGYWANTKPENFAVKFRDFADWAKKQELPGGKKLTLYFTPVEGGDLKTVTHGLLVDWAATEDFSSGVQAHGIYWIQSGQLKSQVLYSVDAFNHGLDASRAVLQARLAHKLDGGENRYPELGVVYDSTYGGSGNPQPVFYLWQLRDSRWQVLWRSDENHSWRNSRGKLNFTGPGLEEFTLESDSWLVNDGKDTIFHESNLGPHRRFLDTWQRKNDHYERKETRTLPSAYNTLVELIYCLSTGREEEAAKLVADAGLLRQAKEYGLTQEPFGQGWLLDLSGPQVEQSGPLTVTNGPAAGVVVEFVEQNGQWLIKMIYRKETR
jgi:tetratricopeptide (TPR) repeat protein